MRYAVLADIHANLQALQATLARARQLGATEFLVAGDLVGYGPQPNECVEVLAGLSATSVAGNHDLIALGRLTDRHCVRLARESLKWTRDALSASTRHFLGSLPSTAEAPGGIVLAHGSLHDPEEYVLRTSQVAQQFAHLERDHHGAGFLVLGHTHLPAAWTWGETVRSAAPSGTLALSAAPWLLNPGAVGQSRERTAHARFLLLDVDQRLATFYTVGYDLDRCREELRRVGLPVHSYHLRPRRRDPWLRPVRRWAGRGRRAMADRRNRS